MNPQLRFQHTRDEDLQEVIRDHGRDPNVKDTEDCYVEDWDEVEGITDQLNALERFRILAKTVFERQWWHHNHDEGDGEYPDICPACKWKADYKAAVAAEDPYVALWQPEDSNG